MQFIDEVIAEDTEAIMELIKDEIIPFFKYKHQEEKKEFEKQIKEMYELEEA